MAHKGEAPGTALEDTRMIEHRYFNASEDPGAFAADLCNRQAVTAAFAFDKLCDQPLYLFSEEADEYGLDPWAMVQGMDRDTSTGEYIVDLGLTAQTRLPADGRLYAQRSTLKALGLPEGKPGGFSLTE